MSSINISFTSHRHGPLIHPWMANQATLPYAGLVHGTARQLCWLWHQVVQASPYLPRGHQYLGKNSRMLWKKVGPCWFTKKNVMRCEETFKYCYHVACFCFNKMYVINHKYIIYIYIQVYIRPYTYPNGSKITVFPLLEICIFPVPSHGCNVASCDRPRVVDRCDAISRHPTPRRKQEHLEVLALLQDHTWDLMGFGLSISTQVPKKQKTTIES